MTRAGWIAQLPTVRGRLTPARALAPLSWLRVGGPAELFFQPADEKDLAGFLARLPPDIPVRALGVCSNLIIRDGGIAGVVIRLGRAFANCQVMEGGRIQAGAAMLDAQIAKFAARAGISGMEFLRTIPGTLGGAVRMNAGCYGHYCADIIERVTAIDRQGQEIVLDRKDIGFAYRTCDLPADMVITGAVLRGSPGDPAQIETRMQRYIDQRAQSQPTAERSCGSTFRNPAGYSSTGAVDDPMHLKAWKLIEDAGCRGLCLGGAQISPKHANFLINTGNATADDLESLGELVRKRVKMHSGHDLVWEIERIGVKLHD